ncbi:hypothetical protein [Streptomyces sp. TRM49041]|uniref:hypothetical protein n=1 Tax=Streptomyces sp. TRM49041 TaxID=2603216 RepID=UPI0011F050D4|nr:hypothetical protein [Streptomyces sp. TRM49041]
MRIRALSAVRAAVAAVAGALLATAAGAPPARADSHDLTPPEILSGSVHGGRTIVLGPNQSLTFQATVTARAAAGIDPFGVEIILFGPQGQELRGIDDPWPRCSPVNSTTSVCTEWFRIETGSPSVTNGYAGDWRMRALVASNNLDRHPESSITVDPNLSTVPVRRKSKLTFVAAPNPVRRGRDLGLLGRLTVADWEANGFTSAPGESVGLEFCADPCRTVESPRSLRTGTYGLTGTTFPATRDGSWWLRYRGSTAFAATYSPGVWVDVQES